MLDSNGYEIRRRVVVGERLHELAGVLGPCSSKPSSGATRSAVCRRNVLAIESVRSFALGPELIGLVAEFAAATPRVVRGILFDKTADANWRVGWHQDLVTAFAKHVEAPGYSAWSDKDGVPHARPPIDLLERMVTIRLHLDDCGPDSGPPMVLPGTHREGELPTEAIRKAAANREPVVCSVKAGDAVVMRPLLLHASEQANTPVRRRVLHLEYAFEDPPGAAWTNWR